MLFWIWALLKYRHDEYKFAKTTIYREKALSGAHSKYQVQVAGEQMRRGLHKPFRARIANLTNQLCLR